MCSLTSIDLWYLPKNFKFSLLIDHPSGFLVGPEEKFGLEGFF